jgi:hypothetical protein
MGRRAPERAHDPRPERSVDLVKPLPDKNQAADFRVQSYRGKPVLTWWQGYLGAGVGSGENVIVDTSYRQGATVRAANGLGAEPGRAGD